MDTQIAFGRGSAFQKMTPLDNYEVAKVENSVSINKPTITFNSSHVYVNVGLLKCAPEMVYVLFLVCKASKNLILRPCDKHELDAVRIRSMNETSLKPRRITGTDFNLRLYTLMQWDANCRYRVAGTLMENGGETLASFDLASAESFQLPIRGEIDPQSQCKHYSLPNSSFGATVGDRLTNPLVKRFAEDSMIPVEAWGEEAEPASEVITH